MLGKNTWGVALVVSLWAKVGLAQAPVTAPVPPAPEPAPPGTAAPRTTTPPPPAAAPSAAPPPAAPAPVPDGPAPGAEPRVRWTQGSESAPSSPEGAGKEPLGGGLSVSPEPADWQLGGSHFVLSVERVTTLLSWRQSAQLPATNVSSSGVEVSSSGVDISLLYGGGRRTPSSLPRIALDAIFSGGFTIGGSLGLVSATGKSNGNAFRSDADLPDLAGGLFAVRAGYFARAGNVAFWMRGGFTYYSASSESDTASGSGLAVSTVKETVTAWDFTLDPQLVLIAAPRIGITLGPLLDIPIAGTDKAEGNGVTTELEYRSSAYGVTGGVAAIF